jgi:hypothetical protein
VIGFYDAVRVARLPVERVRDFGDPTHLFMNINTPDERTLAEHHASTTDAADDRHRRQET